MTQVQPITKTTHFVHTSCGACGIQFAVPDWWLQAKRNNGALFSCPNGCSISFKETETARLQRTLERERNWHRSTAADLKHERASKRALKGQVTKLKKRVAHGVCPCCTRHFTNLERHMATKHPDFVLGETTE